MAPARLATQAHHQISPFFRAKLHIHFERMKLIKAIRTPLVYRSYVTITLLLCPPFYGAYYSFVTGNIPDSAAHAGFVFALLLALLSLLILSLISSIQESMEDPFVSRYQGDRVFWDDEMKLTSSKILVSYFARNDIRFNEDEEVFDFAFSSSNLPSEIKAITTAAAS